MKENISDRSKKLLEKTQNSILLDMPFLALALSRLDFKETKDVFLMTDGESLFYRADFICRLYDLQGDLKVLKLYYMHLLFHCIYQHFYLYVLMDEKYYDLACDIFVENALYDLDFFDEKTLNLDLKTDENLNISINKNSSKSFILKDLKKEISDFNIINLYQYLRENIHENTLKKWSDIFSKDNHNIWYDLRSFKHKPVFYGDFSENSKGESLNSSFVKEDTKEKWEKIFKITKKEIKRVRDQKARGRKNEIMEISKPQFEEYDYSNFLRNFAKEKEVLKLNQDEFDYIFYSYGFNLYEKIALIEPLEYKEIRGIKEFVIAIDTSESTSRGLVEKFVTKTYNILKDTESFFTKVQLYIIQCDEVIEEIKRITSKEEFEDYIFNMKIKGLGGTDFKPVFEYVDSLIRKGELTNLNGLIYFTDGKGQYPFPDNAPNYKTAFVLIEENGSENIDIPSWAKKMVFKD
ncbi:Predicted metal-dependent peptidase [Acetitomaculum ruminis DSM 5522]|uniref:Predicted metal-dependent peptidase n=1 Tax=Acetitomaculum ruminis DSM 5522 TaxID=1120918 RepID=A0A1I0Z9K3_9FIRM|nr:VWA-like domain-containing protein [Acetitomaculum ruminis]SFB21098.1 Predicted metal-dependent peptidase [Acetitomaculum ruminis DSM 5522]